MKRRSGRLRRSQFWTLNVMASVTLALVVVNMFLYLGNRSVQGEVNARQQFINQSIELSRFNNQFIRTLVSLSAETDDKQLRDLLAAHGITFTINVPKTEAAPEKKPK